jgi:hypothetical protein
MTYLVHYFPVETPSLHSTLAAAKAKFIEHLRSYNGGVDIETIDGVVHVWTTGDANGEEPHIYEIEVDAGDAKEFYLGEQDFPPELLKVIQPEMNPAV